MVAIEFHALFANFILGELWMSINDVYKIAILCCKIENDVHAIFDEVAMEQPNICHQFINNIFCTWEYGGWCLFSSRFNLCHVGDVLSFE